MKRITSASCIALFLAVCSAYAVPTLETTPGRIQNSKHDLNSYLNGDTEKSEICIYCHTPHNAVVSIPLWNRYNPTPAQFILYNSPTLTSPARASALATSSISLFCMSCHDGITGLGDVQNKNYIGGPNYVYGIQFSRGVNDAIGAIQGNTIENVRLGTNLSNTHPIGFDFDLVPGLDSGIRDKETIRAIFENKRRTRDPYGRYAEATPAQDFLYGPGNNMFECASCHRVHDPGTSGNFLRIENDRSQLCLACHNK